MILQRYIIREILAPQLGICAVLITIFSGYSATTFLNDAVNGLLPGQMIGILVLLKVLISLDILLPVTLYLAVVLALGRLCADGEATAMAACGIDPGRVVKAVFSLALILAVLVGGLSLYVRPWAYEKIYSMEAGARKEFDFAKLEAGRFYEIGESLIFFSEELDPVKKQARKVYVWEMLPDRRKVTFAEQAYQVDGSPLVDKSILFRNGHHYILNTRTGQGQNLSFGETVLRLTTAPEPRTDRRKAVSTAFLANSPLAEEIAEFHWRLSTGPSTILLALLAVPLGIVAPRSGRYGKATVAIVLFFLYYNLSLIVKTWVEKQTIAPLPGIWWVELSLALLVFALVFLPNLVQALRFRHFARARRDTKL